MKTKLFGLFALAIVLGTGCKKDEIEKQNSMITIDVECAACGLVFNTEYNPETLLQVRTKGSYSFELSKIYTLNLQVFTPSTTGLHQDVMISVKAGNKIIDTKSFSGKAINEKYNVNLSKFKK